MTKQSLEKSTSKRSPSPSESVSLNFQSGYICPVCRHGQITNLTLMDAFACDFCRHIFTANLTEQTIQVVDSSQPMSWRWNGRGWQVGRRDELDLTVVIWVVSAALVGLPSALVWLSAHTFPPLPNSAWAWFPTVWVGCTFLIHFLMVSWLIVEHYQLPLYISTKIRLRQLFDRG